MRARLVGMTESLVIFNEMVNLEALPVPDQVIHDHTGDYVVKQVSWELYRDASELTPLIHAWKAC